ncbi:protein mono-ADP-ribosyltransferase PARP14-like [Ptychodera flava]|uniref:protein mono-ADP-ribosyltransferase PARP14-like n=1 Tax=Ptychodera flava TaxID=63121 RepID=UPI00396A2037
MANASSDKPSIQVVGVSNRTAEETLENYFEIKKRSGGGTISDIKRIGSKYVITFEDPTVIPDVLGRSHVIDGATLQLKLYEPGKDGGCKGVIVEGIPSGTTRDALFYFMESLSEGIDVKSIEAGHNPTTAVVSFESSIDFDKAVTKCQKKRLGGKCVKLTPLETNAIMVRGLNQSTTEDALSFYFENKKSGGGDVESVNMEGDHAVVYFEDASVIDSVLDREHRVFGTTLVVSPYYSALHEPSSKYAAETFSDSSPVSFVTEVRPDLSAHAYVDVDTAPPEPLRSDSFISMVPDDPATSRKRVVTEVPLFTGPPPTSRSHIYSSMPEAPPPKLAEPDREFTMHVDKDIMNFIFNNKDHHSSFISAARLVDSEPHWKAGSSQCKIQSQKTFQNLQSFNIWKNKSEQAVDDFLQGYDTTDIQVDEKFWVTVRNACLDIQDSLLKDHPSALEVKFNSSDCHITVTGLASCVYTAKSKMSQQVKELKAKSELEATKTSAKVTCPNLGKIKLLGRYVDDIGKKFPALDIDSDLGNCEIKLSGYKSEVDEGRLELMIVLSQVDTTHVGIHQQRLAIIRSGRGQEYISSYLTNKDINAAVDVQDDEVVILAVDRGEAKLVKEFITEEFIHLTVDVDVATAHVLKDAKFGSLVKELQEKKVVNVETLKSDGTSQVVISGVKDDVIRSCQELRDFIGSNAIQEELVEVEKQPFKFLQKTEQYKKIESIARSLSDYQIIIYPKPKKGFVVQGSIEGVQRACKKVKAVVQEIENGAEKKRFTGKGICKLFMEENGIVLLKNLEEKHNFVARVETRGTLQSPLTHSVRAKVSATGSVVSASKMTTKEGVTITLKQGNIADEKADFLVLPCSDDLSLGSGAAKSLIVKGGKTIEDQCKQIKTVKNGDIAAIDPGSLPCKKLILAVAGGWDPETGDMRLRSVISKCLGMAINDTSIAIPAIGTGYMGFPKDEVAFIFFDEVQHFSVLNPKSSLKDVRFVVFDKETIDSFQHEMNRIHKLSSVISITSTHGRGAGPMSTRQTLGNIAVEVKQGNLMNESCDAIVNPVNRDCSFGIIGNEILKIGGNTIKDQYSKKIQDFKNGPILTDAGNLQCGGVIHFICQDASRLEDSVSACLNVADSNGMTEISFPALGTGGFGIPAQLSAKSTFRAISKYRSTTMVSVNIVVFQQAMVATFLSELKQYDINPPPTPGRADTKVKVIDGKVKLVVRNGNITKSRVDAIVNPVGKDGGHYIIGKSIISDGGQIIDQEYHKKRGDVKKDPVITGSGKLDCKSVIHVISPDASDLERTVISVLKLAEEKHLSSVALPAIGTGNFGIAAKTAAKNMTDGVINYVTRYKPVHLTDVHFVIFQKDMMKVFEAELKDEAASVTLVVYATSKNEVKDSFTAIETLLKRNVKKERIHHKYLSDYDPGIIKQIQDTADKLCLDSRVDNRKCEIAVEGLEKDIRAFKAELSNFKERYEIAQMFSSTVRWYYHDATGSKREFDAVSSAAIEKAWKKKKADIHLPEGCEPHYHVDLRAKVSTDMRTGRQGKIERETKSADMTFPKDWKKFPPGHSATEPLLVKLDQSSREYQDVERRFKKNAASLKNIVQIQRVQNRHIYEQYNSKKMHFKRKNGKIKNEWRLFQETKAESVKIIAKEGFNRAFAGTAGGTWYGKGTYFAVNSAYSMQDKYTPKDNDGYKWIFEVSVLVGEYAKGSREMLAPPFKATGDRYDSVADNVNNPTAFTIFYDNQACPDYIITFTV